MRKLRLKDFSSTGQNKDPNCKTLANDHFICYYLFFFSQLSKLLLTSVCFTVYFPWLQTMASFLHANSVANLSKLFCVFKIDLQSIATGATLPGCHLKPRQLATPAPSLPDTFSTSAAPHLQALQAFWRTLLLMFLASGYAPTCSCLLSNPIPTSLEALSFPFLCLYLCCSGVWSFELWSPLCLPPVRYNGKQEFL